MHAGVLRDSTGQGSRAHSPALALGRRGTDGWRQRLRGWQEADDPAQPGDGGRTPGSPPASICPSSAKKATLLLPPTTRCSSTNTHRCLEGRGWPFLLLRSLPGDWVGQEQPPSTASPGQPAVGDPPGRQPGPARGQHLSPRQAAKASCPQDYGKARKQAGLGLPALDSPGPRGDGPSPPGWGSGWGFIQAWSAASKSLEAQGHPSPPGSQGPGLLLAPSWTASARNKAETLGLTGPGVACRAGPVPCPFSCPGLSPPLGSLLP